MRKKRKGSVILMVLMVSTVMIILSAVISSSLVFTTNGATREKIKADYLYAAEGGLELGIQKYKEVGLFTTFTVPYLENSSENSNHRIDEVRVEIESLSSGKYISSKAIKNENGTEKLLVQVRVPIDGSSGSVKNILENSIYSSSDVLIENNGSFDYKDINITYNKDSDNGCIIKPTGVVTSDNSNVYKGDTSAAEFRSEVVTKRTEAKVVKSLAELWADPETVEIDVTSKEAEPVILNNGIGKFSIDNFNIKYNDLPGIPPRLGIRYRVILVDAPKLIIDLQGAAGSNVEYIVICSGSIEITSNPSTSTTFISGTLYGNGVYVTGNTGLQIQGSPMNPKNVANFPLRSDQLSYLNTILNKYMTNWGDGSNESSGDSDGNINFDDIEYIIP